MTLGNMIAFLNETFYWSVTKPRHGWIKIHVPPVRNTKFFGEYVSDIDSIKLSIKVKMYISQ
jgi:hypothetical protein